MQLIAKDPLALEMKECGCLLASTSASDLHNTQVVVTLNHIEMEALFGMMKNAAFSLCKCISMMTIQEVALHSLMRSKLEGKLSHDLEYLLLFQSWNRTATDVVQGTTGCGIVFNHDVIYEGQVVKSGGRDPLCNNVEIHPQVKYILRTDIMFERVTYSMTKHPKAFEKDANFKVSFWLTKLNTTSRNQWTCIINQLNYKRKEIHKVQQNVILKHWNCR